MVIAKASGQDLIIIAFFLVRGCIESHARPCDSFIFLAVKPTKENGTTPIALVKATES